MRLTSVIKYGLYHIVKRRPTSENIGSYLSLYNSRHFNGENLQQNLAKSLSSERYKEFFPYLILSTTDIILPKVLVTSLQFNPEKQTLKVTSLRSRGIINQQFHIDKIIPITYADMKAYTKIPEPTLPPYIDDTMVYFNTFNKNFYLFQQDGLWNQETVNHPKLSLDQRIRQKEWFDRRHGY